MKVILPFGVFRGFEQFILNYCTSMHHLRILIMTPELLMIEKVCKNRSRIIRHHKVIICSLLCNVKTKLCAFSDEIKWKWWLCYRESVRHLFCTRMKWKFSSSFFILCRFTRTEPWIHVADSSAGPGRPRVRRLHSRGSQMFRCEDRTSRFA